MRDISRLQPQIWAAGVFLLAGCGGGAASLGNAAALPSQPTGAGSATTTVDVATSSDPSSRCVTAAPRTDQFPEHVALTTTTADGLKYGDLVAGSGTPLLRGESATFQY